MDLPLLQEVLNLQNQRATKRAQRKVKVQRRVRVPNTASPNLNTASPSPSTANPSPSTASHTSTAAKDKPKAEINTVDWSSSKSQTLNLTMFNEL